MVDRDGPVISERYADPAGEFPFSTENYLFHLLAAICQFRDAAIDRELKDHGLNVARYRVLGVLNRFGLCTMTEVATFTAIDRTTLTRMVDQLVDTKFVERKAGARDRRQVLLEMTELGREAYLAGLLKVFECNAAMVSGLSDEDQRATVRALRRIVENLAPSDVARDSIIGFSREALASSRE